MLVMLVLLVLFALVSRALQHQLVEACHLFHSTWLPGRPSSLRAPRDMHAHCANDSRLMGDDRRKSQLSEQVPLFHSFASQTILGVSLNSGVCHTIASTQQATPEVSEGRIHPVPWWCCGMRRYIVVSPTPRLCAGAPAGALSVWSHMTRRPINLLSRPVCSIRRPCLRLLAFTMLCDVALGARWPFRVRGALSKSTALSSKR
jgi:hypothetical protein